MAATSETRSANYARVRSLRKKLQEIANLEQRIQDEGYEPSMDQERKLERRPELEEELEELLELDEAEAAQASAVASTGNGKAHKTNGQTQHRHHHPVHASPMSEELGELRFDRRESARWQDDPASVEDVTTQTNVKPEEEGVEIIDGVSPFAASTQASERLRSLVRAASHLSKQAFDEDALEMVSKKSKWKLMMMAMPEGARLEEDQSALIGFVIYRVRVDLQCLSIAKVAVMPEHRRKGHGCQLIDWCIRLARKQKEIVAIALSSLPEAVRFYKRMGFKASDVKILKGKDDDDDYVEGQVYMEYKIRGGRAKRR